MEEQVRVDGKIMQVGHTREYMKILLETEEDLQNQIINVKIH